MLTNCNLLRLGRAILLPSSSSSGTSKWLSSQSPLRSVLHRNVNSPSISASVGTMPSLLQPSSTSSLILSNKSVHSWSRSRSISTSTSTFAHPAAILGSSPSLFSIFHRVIQNLSHGSVRRYATLEEMHKWGGPHKKFRPPRKPLDGKPMLKGIVLKTLIKKPKKPNSANRKCVLVRLSNGKEMVAYVPGIGHNLQEHNIVLVRVGRLQDVPGVKLKCIRGKFDLAHVQKASKS